MFISKGETLLNLKKKLINFEIPNLFIFKVGNWKTNKNEIVSLIKKKFKNKTIIVRSSSALHSFDLY